MCKLFPYIPIFRGVFLLKSVKKCLCVMGLKIALLLVKSVFINLGEGMSELWHWLAAKYTTLEILILLKGWTGTKNFYDS